MVFLGVVFDAVGSVFVDDVANAIFVGIEPHTIMGNTLVTKRTIGVSFACIIDESTLTLVIAVDGLLWSVAPHQAILGVVE